MRRHRSSGQVLLLFLAALGIFLAGAVGFAIDASFLFTHRQLAQSAADAAAQAAIMSVFNKTNTAAFGNTFGSAAFTCSTGTDQRTPCAYARYHGFGDSPNETVTVDFPGSVDGVALSVDDTPAAVQVTVSRVVDTGLIRFLGPAAATVRARAIAVITRVFSPVPIVVLHPTREGAFSMNGNPTLEICGGPFKSIQVNSSNPQSIQISGNASLLDLSRAGPRNWAGPNSCAGLGGDLGNFGGPNTYPGSINLGSEGHYVYPGSPVADPLAFVAEPANPGVPGVTVSIPGGSPGCPLPPSRSCTVYSPGTYSQIRIQNEFALFNPGLYYITSGGFEIRSNGIAHMAPCIAPIATFGCGMVIYNSASSSAVGFASNSGQLQGTSYSYTFPDGTTCTGNCLLGANENGPFGGILFFQARSSPARYHTLIGGAGLVLRGTIYMTNTEATMRANPNTFQTLELQGTPGSTTRVVGMIIVDRLTLGGNATLRMTLNPTSTLNVRQVALVR